MLIGQQVKKILGKNLPYVIWETFMRVTKIHL